MFVSKASRNICAALNVLFIQFWSDVIHLQVITHTHARARKHTHTRESLFYMGFICNYLTHFMYICSENKMFYSSLVYLLLNLYKYERVSHYRICANQCRSAKLVNHLYTRPKPNQTFSVMFSGLPGLNQY